MATANFVTQDNFPLFATEIFDAHEYEDDETGETVLDDWTGYIFFQDCKAEIEQLNSTLKYYQLELRDGYYGSTQLYLAEQHEGATTADCTAEEWRKARQEAKRYPGCYYSWEFELPYAEQKRAELRELAKITAFCRGTLCEEYAFHEYTVYAHFSNGETLYELAA